MYCPGKTNIANGLFHLHSVDQVDHREDNSFVRPLAESCIHIALWPRETEEASHDDEELMRVKHFKSVISLYPQVKDKLWVYGELLLHSRRVVVPRLLCSRVIWRALGYSEDQVWAL